MSRTIPVPRVVLFALGFLVLSLAAVASGPRDAEAAAQSCSAYTQEYQKRRCTFLEEYGNCLFNAYDSYDTCMESARRRKTGLSRSAVRLACGIGVQVDLFACHLALPVHIFKDLTRS